MKSLKSLRFLPVLSLVFAVVLSLVGMAAFGAPVGVDANAEGTFVTAVADSADVRPQPDIDSIYRVLIANRLFGGDIYNDEALVEEAQIYLLDRVETVDGTSVIRRDTVNGFISALYGHKVSNSSDGDYYVVGARGYDPIGHEVTDISLDGGRVVVRSRMRMGANDPVNCVTVLSPCQNEFGYMIISADIVE